MAKAKPQEEAKPVPIDNLDVLVASLQNVRSVIFEARAAVDAVDLAVARVLQKLATQQREAVEGAWGEKKGGV